MKLKEECGIRHQLLNFCCILFLDDDESPLLAYKDRLFELFGSSVSPAVSDFIPLTMVAIQGLLEMLLSSNLLAGQEMYTAVQIIQSVILLDGSSSKLKLDENVSKNTKDQQTLYKFATEALRQYSVLRTEVILETSIPVLFENLPVSLPYSSAISDQRLQADLPLLLEKSKRILMTVRELCAEHKIFEACIPLLVEKLENACSSTAFSEADSSSLAEAYCVVLLDGLLSAFKKQGVSGTFSKSSLLESATLFLIKASARACLSASSVAQVGLMGQRASLDIVGKLLTFLIRHMDTR